MQDSPSRRSIGSRRNPASETAILDAADELIAEKGIGALRMEDVARRAAASKATLYRWWPSRAHLLLALYNRSKDTLPVPDTGMLRQDLVDYMFSMFEHWREPVSGGVFRGLIAEAQSDPDVRATLIAARQERWRHIGGIFLRAAERGELAVGMTVAAAETRMAATAWYLLLTDEMPRTKLETAALVADLIRPLLNERAIAPPE
ncbi:TetR family transcriptional regulator [Haematobacter missouriensis]|uniref:TetR family transcriptional regulator n=1 Tax=Haematobacter missouriensis TaxID=366616 RepID=A0A212AWU0_9RHOB|nr:TetR/AcrR family transcriptional regulator [Haematobacter missouriensis]KFI33956.1 TetR family transcriptional regulator [Haematobacter missouriensis]OWJ71272.1 TetR family transcriptional regulator [Haematobacter missouriensis]OWJ85952.1 TetR family transcriptional regulator [Haematobacter missouriensis]